MRQGNTAGKSRRSCGRSGYTSKLKILERIAPKTDNGSVLIVGAGPVGLEAALAAGRRGYDVILAEATDELGGRVSCECRLPGLAVWSRVRDYRTYLLSQMANVEVNKSMAGFAVLLIRGGT